MKQKKGYIKPQNKTNLVAVGVLNTLFSPSTFHPDKNKQRTIRTK